MHIYPDDTKLTKGDTFGGWLYKPTGSATQDGTTYAAPAWQLLLPTADSLPGGDVGISFAYSNNTGVAELVAAPSNTNVLGAIVNNSTYVSTNKGMSWTNMGFTVTLNPNGGPLNNAWMAFDPNNQDIAYMVTPSSGAYVNTGMTTGGSWTRIAAIANSDGNGGNVYFDFTSSHPGNVTQRILISVNGAGVYETINGGSSWALTAATNRPSNVSYLIGDKFGTIWAGEGFRGTSGLVYKYASSAWTIPENVTIPIVAIMFDPNTGAVQANNHVIVASYKGQLVCSLDDGATWGPGQDLSLCTIAATGAQPGWLGVANQYDNSGNLNLSLNTAGIDSAGTIWGGTGIDVFTTPNPIVAGVVETAVAWSANTIGIDQLVTNQIISAPGSSPLAAVWDRGDFLCKNPDVFPTSQFPNASNIASPFTYQPIQGAWSADYVPGTPTTFVSPIASQSGGPTILGKSTDGANTWSPITQPSVGIGLGGVIALSTTTNYAIIPGDFNGGNVVIYATNNSGTTWASATIPNATFTATRNSAFQLTITAVTGTIYKTDTITGTGIPANTTITGQVSGVAGGAGVYNTNNDTTASAASVTAVRTFLAFNNGHFANRQPLVADRMTANKFYAVDLAQNFYVSTDSGATFTPTAATIGGEFVNGRDFLMAVPGNAGHVFYSTGGGGGSHLWKSTNSLASVAQVPASGALTTIKGFGMGAPLPGGSGYPTLYVWGQLSGIYGLYQSTDAGVTWAASNIPAGEFWPFRSMDSISCMSGDMNVYGRVYVGFLGSGACYIDTADAVPWVNFSNINSNDNRTGTVTLTAQHSGRVPVKSVQFSVDGANIGLPQTGIGPYSVSWDTSGIAHGAHTLKVETFGYSPGSGSFSIPITTS